MSNQHIYGQQIGFITDGIKNIKIFHQLINTQSLWIKGITTNCSNTQKTYIIFRPHMYYTFAFSVLASFYPKNRVS